MRPLPSSGMQAWTYEGQPMEHLNALAVGTRLAEYEVIAVLRTGGFGLRSAKRRCPSPWTGEGGCV